MYVHVIKLRVRVIVQEDVAAVGAIHLSGSGEDGVAALRAPTDTRGVYCVNAMADIGVLPRRV
jgi:hypothetical protein